MLPSGEIFYPLTPLKNMLPIPLLFVEVFLLVVMLTFLSTLLWACIWTFGGILALKILPSLVLNNPNTSLGSYGSLPYEPIVLSRILMTSIGKYFLLLTSPCVTRLGHQCSIPLSSFPRWTVFLSHMFRTYFWWNHYFQVCFQFEVK